MAWMQEVGQRREQLPRARERGVFESSYMGGTPLPIIA